LPLRYAQFGGESQQKRRAKNADRAAFRGILDKVPERTPLCATDYQDRRLPRLKPTGWQERGGGSHVGLD
jgi:hypothetical protein